ncbi:glucuronyl hydrolase [Vibrio inusitatus NBRC 102082]|uniref:Glucuronyl hydrolase n=1 Tax=Vibrio inusitatus NBRC 102082 TaxID=1219070 RepID=A0A4Y3HYQ2_9VIBR|nr:glycoside hydrolase family 88 protein [Vibrio inusitatus]GEA52121.1 glucuronyl hydrolase [Vibrio inusitatus NBRC 102082]
MLKQLLEIQADIVSNIERNAPIIGLRNPMIGAGAEDFTWLYPEDYFWTDSFWTGNLWLAHMLTGKDELKNLARMRYAHFKDILDKPLWLNHDLGFEYSLTAVADYKLTGNRNARELALKAADALRSRFNWHGKYLVAWEAGAEDTAHAESVQGKIIIDCMQNLSLLMWAWKETNVQAYRDVAIAQADTTLKYIVRDDFSTYHTFDFDTSTNKPIKGCTHQGYADESCWSRGQAWAIHGFAQMALLTGDERYIEASMKLADYVFEHITPDLVPVWDYLLPEYEIQYKDTSAGSITAAGLFLLGEVLRSSNHIEKAVHYESFGRDMLFALRKKFDISAVPDSQGLLSNAASHLPQANEKDLDYMANAMLPYGDYYYFEAVLRAMGHKKLFW